MKKMTLRLPDDLHEELSVIADHRERSLHGQIIFLLRQALELDKERNAAHAVAGSREAANHRDREL
jgi:predicted transcriptional regulator